MFTFTNEKVALSSNNLPANTLAWAVVSVKGIKSSQNTGGELADLELTILGGPYEGRKLFPKIGSPLDDKNSEKYREMGYAAILHMMESAGLVDINNGESYMWLNHVNFTDMMAYLDGKAVAVKTRIEKDKTGTYPDRDGVGEFLSPNPNRSGSAFKGYQALAEGKHSLTPTVPNGPAAGAPGLPGIASGSAPQPGGLPGANRPAAPQAPAAAFRPIGGGVPSAAALGAPQGVQMPPRPPMPPAAGQPPQVGAAVAAPSWLAPSAADGNPDQAAGVTVQTQPDGMP